MKKHPLADLDDDIRDHLARETADNIDRGMTPDDARAAALRKFGNVALVREDTRAVWIPVLAEQAMQDVRYAARTLRRQPGFTASAILMLTIGLGLVAGGYTVFNGLFVRGWAVPDSDRVFRLPPSASRRHRLDTSLTDSRWARWISSAARRRPPITSGSTSTTSASPRGPARAARTAPD